VVLWNMACLPLPSASGSDKGRVSAERSQCVPLYLSGVFLNHRKRSETSELRLICGVRMCSRLSQQRKTVSIR
jgi:hypothetical protein